MTTITTEKPKDWDAESISRVARMLAVGKSTRDIGAAFGVSRNSVLGLCFRRREAGDERFGLRGKHVGRTPEEAAEARRLRDAAKRERSDSVASWRASREGRRTPPRPRIDLGPDPGRGLRFQDVDTGQCHYVGAGGYCAQPCGRATYCAHHRAIIYRPSVPVRDAYVGRTA